MNRRYTYKTLVLKYVSMLVIAINLLGSAGFLAFLPSRASLSHHHTGTAGRQFAMVDTHEDKGNAALFLDYIRLLFTDEEPGSCGQDHAPNPAENEIAKLAVFQHFILDVQYYHEGLAIHFGDVPLLSYFHTIEIPSPPPDPSFVS